MRIACLLPAAGASSRMRGGDKLLELVDGLPCLRVMANRALAAGLEVIVTLPNADHPRASVLGDLDLKRIVVHNATDGMSASLKAGAAFAKSFADGLMILPPDMPALELGDLEEIANAFLSAPNSIVQATTIDANPGHPTLFPKSLLSKFRDLEGDRGAASICLENPDLILQVKLEDQRARLDLDTPEDWVKWGASHV
ncbi:nucleotidyltransferase family protein [Planktotalea sp.]|uniref:nucleotidyltransferase family protein n=1 Tax=Planktotalea sp. TaxID=2029877 RepID=UPI0025CC8C9D|nr:nucleotidyltransferase family protein [Planktotalea sp.]